MDFKNALLYYLVLFIAAVAGVWFTWHFAVDFAEYAVTIAYTVIIIGLFHWFDSKVMKGIDTIRQLKKGNVAYATFLLAIAVLFHAVATAVW